MTNPYLAPSATAPSPLPIQLGFASIVAVALALVLPWVFNSNGAGVYTIVIAVIFGFAGFILLAVALLVGLPIRLIGGVRAWWIAHPLVSNIGLGIGLAGVLVGLATSFVQLRAGLPVGPEPLWVGYLIAGIGWFVALFSAVHSWAVVAWYRTRKARPVMPPPS